MNKGVFMIKKISIISIVFVLMFSVVCSLFFVFRLKKENNNDTMKAINISYMKNLSIDVSGSKAFGIKKDIIKDSSAASATSLNVSFLNAKVVSASSDKGEKNYLYSTTEYYKNGQVEYNDNTISKVKFKKNPSVQEDVFDSDGNLIDSNKEISQEEIPAQINKLYVNQRYMFMQFVAIVSKSGDYRYNHNDEAKSEYIELRPDKLIYDENGISEFDMKNYYSSDLSQSFVIDMSNGNIYKITNFNIATIHDTDIVKDNSGNYYKMSINSNKELVFTDIMPNKEIYVHAVVTDKYGYTFVENHNLNTTDSVNKIIYFTGDKYMISDTKEVYLMDYDAGTFMCHIEKCIIDGVEQPFDNSAVISRLRFFGGTITSLIGYYKNKRVYDGSLYSAGGRMLIEGSLWSEYGEWFNDDLSSSILLLNRDGKLSYKLVDFDLYINNPTTLTISDFTKIFDGEIELYNKDYYINVGANKVKIKNVYIEKNFTETKYYQLTRIGNEIKLILLQDVEYSQQTYIFQPIKK